jgi:coenzyme F420-reducing hydrogenase delta subunit
MDKEPIKVVVYHCRNLRLFEDGNQKAFMRERPGIRLVAIPCSGKVEAHHLLKTLADGVDGVLVCACAEKACRYLEGSMRARKRMQYAREWLQKLDINPYRIEFVHTPPMDLKALERILEDFVSGLRQDEEIPSPAEAQAG